MITSGIMEILHKAIQIYDKRCGKEYLIVFGSKNHFEYKFIQIKIKQSYFWHLLGCRLDADSNEGKNTTYLNCKNNINVADKISSVHKFSEIQEKYSAIQNVFDFVEKAKQIKVCYAFDCPEEFLFKIGSGNTSGIIGYDYSNNGSTDFLFPKSAQLKSISKISKTTYRIFLILSKKIGDKFFNNIEYEIKNDICIELKEFIPKDVKISQHLFGINETKKNPKVDNKDQEA